jgi:hypothetical protein
MLEAEKFRLTSGRSWNFVAVCVVPVDMGRVFLIGLVILVAGCHPPSQPGEFDGEGTVYGRIVYMACNATTPPVCRPARLPANVGGASQDAPVHIIGKAGGGDFGVDGRHGGFGGFVAAGHYTARVPLLERPGCAPRPRFDVMRQLRYKVVFRFAAPGNCSATVWQVPWNNHGQLQAKVVSRVAG